VIVFRTLTEDIRAIRKNDPAAKNIVETLLCHTPLHAILIYRIAHVLHAQLHIPVLPRVLSTFAHWWSGVEIHPGARIGRGFFVDHGSGVVIGETTEIGNNCVMFHNVTLGGTGKHRRKRHPTIGSNVFIGTGTILLGPIRVGNNVKIGANTFVIMHDIPPDCTVVGTPGRIVRRNGIPANESLIRTPEPED
jgi:serine O-acetyltransferase